MYIPPAFNVTELASIHQMMREVSLASLVSVLLCAIAVAMSARRYVQRHLDAVALLKTLGATRAFTLSVSVFPSDDALQLILYIGLPSFFQVTSRPFPAFATAQCQPPGSSGPFAG